MNDRKLVDIEQRIYSIRGVRVMLDSDLAVIYGVSTKRLNEQFRRNRKRFPQDFAFQLTPREDLALRSQFATSKDPLRRAELMWSQIATSSAPSTALRSQIATLKLGRGQHRKYLPHVFTEHGALMVANVLNSRRAVQMSVFVIRAFVKMREQLATNAAILKRLAEIDQSLLMHDSELRDIYRKLRPLLAPPPEPERPRIGFSP